MTSALPSTHTAFRDSGISGVLTLRFHRSGNRGNTQRFHHQLGRDLWRLAQGRYPVFRSRPERRGAVQGPPGSPKQEKRPGNVWPPSAHKFWLQGALKGEEPRVPLVRGSGGRKPTPGPRAAPPAAHGLHTPPADQSQNYIPRFAGCKPFRKQRKCPLVPGEPSSVLLRKLACFSFLPLIYRLFWGLKVRGGHGSNKVGYKRCSPSREDLKTCPLYF